MNITGNEIYTGQPEYHDAFWDVVRGKNSQKGATPRQTAI